MRITAGCTINGQELSTRDGLGLWDVDQLIVKADSDVEFLLMEVQME
jgi:redox-sensitive bicupin YhaK (pirin superfamily)